MLVFKDFFFFFWIFRGFIESQALGKPDLTVKRKVLKSGSVQKVWARLGQPVVLQLEH